MMRLVIPLDDSEFSRSVFPYVERTFHPRHWQLDLIHVAAPPTVRQLPASTGSVGGRLAGGHLPGGLTAPDVQASPPYGGFPSQRREGERRRLEGRLQRDAAALRARGYEVATEVRFGVATATEIAQAVQERSADAVAMATHGRTALGRLLRGSVAEALVHRLTTPVLLVRGSPIVRAGPAGHDPLRRAAASGREHEA